MKRAVIIITILVAAGLFRLENQIPTAEGGQNKVAPAVTAPAQPNELLKVHLFK